MLDNEQMDSNAEAPARDDEPKGKPGERLAGALNRKLIAGALLLCATLGALFLIPRTDPPPDFRALTAGPERKQTFFGYFSPLIDRANAAIARQREKLEAIAAAGVIDGRAERQLQRLAIEYGLEPEALSTAELLDATLRRVDQLPRSLVLAQAAKESGWGTSRFAVEANNFFGQRCWTSGCGVKPQRRPEGARFEVARFSSPYESLVAYLKNLNTHHEYEPLRDFRATVREDNGKLSGLALADHLGTYSEREEKYRKEIKKIITANRLETTTP